MERGVKQLRAGRRIRDEGDFYRSFILGHHPNAILDWYLSFRGTPRNLAGPVGVPRGDTQPFLRPARPYKIEYDRYHFGTCCPRNDDTYSWRLVSRSTASCWNSREITGCQQRGTRHATTFPSTRLIRLCRGRFCRGRSARAALRRVIYKSRQVGD
jgi:hypothetical protein